MANYKRRKPRRHVRCKMCTARGGVGNGTQHDRGRNLNGKHAKNRLPEIQEQLL